MSLILSGLIFGIFFVNVVMGAFQASPFMGDVAEMLTLLASAVLFVVAILGREADRDRKNTEGG